MGRGGGVGGSTQFYQHANEECLSHLSDSSKGGRRLHVVTGDVTMKGGRPWARVWMHRSAMLHERYYNLVPVYEECQNQCCPLHYQGYQNDSDCRL